MDAQVAVALVLLVGWVLLALSLRWLGITVWVTAAAAGLSVPLMQLVGMRLRGVNAAEVVLPWIKARKAGLDLSLEQLEAHHLAGGRIDPVVGAMIRALRDERPAGWREWSAADLAGRNLDDADAIADFVPAPTVDLERELGAKAFADLVRFREWLREHPRRRELLQFLERR